VLVLVFKFYETPLILYKTLKIPCGQCQTEADNLCLSALVCKLAGGYLEISRLCAECRLQETLIGQASAGTHPRQI
jgi:hypothetical protein